MTLTKKKRERYEKLARMRMEGHTFIHCGTALGVTDRQARRWASTEDYKEIFREMQLEAQGNAKARARTIGNIAIDTLVAVCQSGRLGQAQVMAAKTLGEWAGLADQQEAEVRDDKQELIQLAEMIRLRREERHLHLHLEGVKPPELPAVVEGVAVELEPQ
jgi:hypothetical protein